MIQFKTIRHTDPQFFDELVQASLDEGWLFRDLLVCALSSTMIMHVAYMTRMKP